MLNKTALWRQSKPYRETDGTKHMQVDVYKIKFTYEDDRRLEYEVIERVSCKDKASFDNGGTIGGGMTKAYLSEWIDEGRLTLI